MESETIRSVIVAKNKKAELASIVLYTAESPLSALRVLSVALGPKPTVGFFGCDMAAFPKAALRRVPLQVACKRGLREGTAPSPSRHWSYAGTKAAVISRPNHHIELPGAVASSKPGSSENHTKGKRWLDLVAHLEDDQLQKEPNRCVPTRLANV